MWSEKHIIEMVDSYNCLRLDNKHVFQVEVYEDEKDENRQKFFEFDDKKIPFVDLKVGQLAKFISVQEKFEVSKLWKVDVDKSELNPGSADDGIKELGGVPMEFEYDFIDYFQGDYKPTRKKIHIVAIVATTTTEFGRNSKTGPNWNKPVSVYEWIQQFTLNRNRIRLVSTFGGKFKFCGRDNAVNVLWNGAEDLDLSGIVTRFKNRKISDKSLHPIPFLAGGPGVGKSRFLDEIDGLLKREANVSDNVDISHAFSNLVVINTTYGNGSPAATSDVAIDVETSLAIRILFEYFRPKPDHGDFTFSNFSSLITSKFTPDTALRVVYHDFIKQKNLEIDHNPLLVLVLGIDEVNKLYDLERDREKIGISAFKNLISAIGGTMCQSPENIFFIPILAGTIEGPLNRYITGSMHEPLPLPLSLLNEDDAIEIGKAINLFDDEYVRLHPYFRLSISDIGGHVKTLEYYYRFFEIRLQSEMKKTEKEEAVYNVRIEEIMEQVKYKIAHKYHLQTNSRWLTIPLAKAILGFPVQKDDDIILSDGSSMPYQELSSQGVVNLVPVGLTECLIRLPYVWVCVIVKNSNDSGMTYWKSMLKYDEPMNWQNFEDFNAKFWALRLSLFRSMGYEKINLKTLCKGADFSLSFPDVEVDLPQEDIKLYKLLHRYPVTKTYVNNQVKYANMTEVRNSYIDLDFLKDDNIKSYIGCVFLNASGAPFDAFGFLNKSSESAGEICVAQQSKSTTTSKVLIDQGLFDKEHLKVSEAMNAEKKDWALLFLTNADKKNLSICNNQNSALVSVENFQKFYGYTYTSRAQFASANEEIYLNNAPVESLVILGFNEDERIDIRLKRRERTFDDLDDLKKRLKIDDERFEKLKTDRISFN